MPSSINSYIFAIFAAVVDSREALSTDESRSAGLLPKAESMRSRRDSPPSPLILYRLFASDIIDGECDEIMNCAFVKMQRQAFGNRRLPVGVQVQVKLVYENDCGGVERVFLLRVCDRHAHGDVGD